MMKKTGNYKILYELTKKHRLVDPQPQNNLDDSLEEMKKPVRRNTIKVSSHNRSQSCPFMDLDIQKAAIQRVDSLQVENSQTHHEKKRQKTRKPAKRHMPEKKSKIAHKHSSSQFSQSTNTVIVHNNIPLERLSSVLYTKKSDGGKSQASTICKWGIKLRDQIYLKTKLQQQIKAYELNEELAQIHRESKGVTIKQEILETMLNKYVDTKSSGDSLRSHDLSSSFRKM